MAKKRAITVKRPAEEPDGGVPEETWWEWFRYKYARYWYAVLAMGTTFFSSLEVLRHDEWDINVPLALIVLFGSSILFIWGYLKLFWGKNRFGDSDDEHDD